MSGRDSFYEEIFIAGLGGQGLMLMGQVLAYAAMEEGKNCVWYPSYGPEMRGGFAYCRTIISTDEIGSPVGIEPDTVIIMHGNFLDVAEELKSGGRLFLNSSLCGEIPQRDDWKIYAVPANELAEEIGSARVANFVMLGAYLELVPVVSPQTVISVMPKVIPARRREAIPLNEKALYKGQEYAKRWKE